MLLTRTNHNQLMRLRALHTLDLTCKADSYLDGLKTGKAH